MNLYDVIIEGIIIVIIKNKKLSDFCKNLYLYKFIYKHLFILSFDYITFTYFI